MHGIKGQLSQKEGYILHQLGIHGLIGFRIREVGACHLLDVIKNKAGILIFIAHQNQRIAFLRPFKFQAVQLPLAKILYLIARQLFVHFRFGIDALQTAVRPGTHDGDLLKTQLFRLLLLAKPVQHAFRETGGLIGGHIIPHAVRKHLHSLVRHLHRIHPPVGIPQAGIRTVRTLPPEDQGPQKHQAAFALLCLDFSQAADKGSQTSRYILHTLLRKRESLQAAGDLLLYRFQFLLTRHGDRQHQEKVPVVLHLLEQLKGEQRPGGRLAVTEILHTKTAEYHIHFQRLDYAAVGGTALIGIGQRERFPDTRAGHIVPAQLPGPVAGRPEAFPQDILQRQTPIRQPRSQKGTKQKIPQKRAAPHPAAFEGRLRAIVLLPLAQLSVIVQEFLCLPADFIPQWNLIVLAAGQQMFKKDRVLVFKEPGIQHIPIAEGTVPQGAVQILAGEQCIRQSAQLFRMPAVVHAAPFGKFKNGALHIGKILLLHFLDMRERDLPQTAIEDFGPSHRRAFQQERIPERFIRACGQAVGGEKIFQQPQGKDAALRLGSLGAFLFDVGNGIAL